MTDSAKLTGEAIPPAVQRAAWNLRVWGRVGLWTESTLGAISGFVLLAAFLAYANLQGKESQLGGGVAFTFVAIGLVAIGISSYFFSRYIRISQRLVAVDAASRPSRAEILRLVRIGLLVNLGGMGLTLAGAFAITGIVLFKALTQPTIVVGADPADFVNAFDILLFQAFLNSILAHFTGIVTCLWLLDRVTR